MDREKERETYALNRELLLKTAPDKFVLIYGDQIAGLFDTREIAEYLGTFKYGLASYLVMRVGDGEAPPRDGGRRRVPPRPPRQSRILPGRKSICIRSRQSVRGTFPCRKRDGRTD